MREGLSGPFLGWILFNPTLASIKVHLVQKVQKIREVREAWEVREAIEV